MPNIISYIVGYATLALIIAALWNLQMSANRITRLFLWTGFGASVIGWVLLGLATKLPTENPTGELNLFGLFGLVSATFGPPISAYGLFLLSQEYRKLKNEKSA